MCFNSVWILTFLNPHPLHCTAAQVGAVEQAIRLLLVASAGDERGGQGNSLGLIKVRYRRTAFYPVF